MGEQRFTTSLTPHITVEACGGDLAIAAVAEPEVVITFEGDDVDIQREGETLRMRSGGDCRITCPPDSTITLHSVGGDLRASDRGGTLAVESVGGDVSLRGAGMVTIRSAASDVSARDVAGDLRIENVGSDLEVRRIDGRLSVNSVGGTLSARTLDGGMEIESVGGDASIETDIAPGKTYRVNAGGDVTLRIPRDANARFKLSAGGEIEKHVEFAGWQGNKHSGSGSMGDGNAQIEMSAGGDLTLLPLAAGAEFDFNFNFDTIGSQIGSVLDARMQQLSETIARATAAGITDLESRLHRVDAEGIGRRVERATEHARRQVERAAERARRQAERAAERERRRAERHAKKHGFHFNVEFTRPGTAPPGTAKPAATEEERLMILRMLEQHKISADEAGRLLDALEG